MLKLPLPLVLSISLLWTLGCEETKHSRRYDVANECVTVVAIDHDRGTPPSALQVSESGDAYRFGAGSAPATPFFLKPSGLGTYLFYDDAASYLVSDGNRCCGRRRCSDVLTSTTPSNPRRNGRSSRRRKDPWVRARHLRSGRYLATEGWWTIWTGRRSCC
jgi:hypothetical protein